MRIADMNTTLYSFMLLIYSSASLEVKSIIQLIIIIVNWKFTENLKP